MYLIDSCIILEFLLGQERAQIVESFLKNLKKEEIFVSDFTLHSLGIILLREKMPQCFLQILKDVIEEKIKIIGLEYKELERVIKVHEKFGLDFDDAYQYVVAEKYNLKIVSFDSDFDKTTLGRILPQDLISS